MRGGEEYLAQYPKLLRWMNRCVACQRVGYKPDMPDQIYRHFSVSAANIRQYFAPLDVDSDGLCEQCRAAKRTPQQD
jgi:hypothetical protein